MRRFEVIAFKFTDFYSRILKINPFSGLKKIQISFPFHPKLNVTENK